MRSLVRLLAFILIAAGGYALSARLAAEGAMPLLGVECRAGLVRVTCLLPADGAPDWRVYAIAAAAVVGLWCVGALFVKDWVLYPFIVLFGTLSLCAMAYDLALLNGLVSGEKLINDTFNVLRLLVLGSFTLTFVMARRTALNPFSVVAAVASSYAATLAAMFGFLLIHARLFGAFELFVLYVVYAFGGFTVHLMTLSLLVSGAKPPADELARSARLSAALV
jgi:hypothetical protein